MDLDILKKLSGLQAEANVVKEGMYDGKSREELLKLKAEAEAWFEKNPGGIGSTADSTADFLKDTEQMQMKLHLDSINDALKKLGESKTTQDGSGPWYKEQRAKEAYEKANPGKRWSDLPYGYKEDWRRKTESVESGEMVEAAGDFAEPFYQLQDEFCGGECDSPAHKALIDSLIGYMSGDDVRDFVDTFRREHDMDNMDEGKYGKKKKYEDVENVEESIVDKIIDDILDHDPSDESVMGYVNKHSDKLSDADYKKLHAKLKDMGYDEEVIADLAENKVEETVEVAVNDLRSLLALAGLNPQATTEAEVELDEYANSPDEDYQDADTQLNKMSGGLNGPKGQHKKEYPGDNPLAVELAEKLKAMLDK